MFVPRLGLALVLFSGCDGNDDDATTVDACDAPDAPTWENHAEGWVATWCQPCHTAQLTTLQDRQNAPLGVNFDTWSQVYDFRVPIRDRVTYVADADDTGIYQMPPTGGIDPHSVARFVQWIDCGAEGTDDVPSECAAPTTSGDVVVASQAEADALCAGGAVALGTLEVRGAVEIGCACSITADLVLGPGSAEVSLPLLSSIGGNLRASSDGTLHTLAAPELVSVTGDVLLADEAALTSFDAPALATVGGDLTATGLASLTALDLPGLISVGGAFVVSDDAALETIDVSRLRTVGAAMELTELPSLTALEGTRALEKIGSETGGGLVLTGLDSLATLDDFAFLLLEEVHGDLEISDNAALFGIDGFAVFGIDTYMFLPGPDLMPVEIPHEHAILITGNPNLDHIDGFGNLRVTTGNIEIRNSPVHKISGFVNLRELGGDLVLDELTQLDELTGFVGLKTVGGSVVLTKIAVPVFTAFGQVTNITGNLTLASSGVQAFGGFLQLQTLGGDLAFTSNVLMVDLASFPDLAAVGGSLAIVANPQLDLFESAGIASVGVDVLIQDNDSLVALPGLDALATVGNDLSVIDNASLPTADITAWASGIIVGGETVISGNQ